MRVRVELRRQAGIWIARFRKQSGVTGDLRSEHREVEGRQVKYLCVTNEKDPYNAAGALRLELFNVTVLDVHGVEVRLAGLECVDRAWHAQEWDVTLLHERRAA